jgi:hypothetical protein
MKIFDFGVVVVNNGMTETSAMDLEGGRLLNAIFFESGF